MTPQKIAFLGEGILPTSLLQALFPPPRFRPTFYSAFPEDIPPAELPALFLVRESHPGAALGFIRRLRAEHPSLPLVWLTTEADGPTTAAAFRCGANDVLIKPDPERVQEVALHMLAHPPAVDTPTAAPARRWMERVAEVLRPQTRVGALAASSGKKSTQRAAFPLEVQFFGPLVIRYQGREVPLELGLRDRSILAYLLYHHPQAHHKERLMEQFWPDYLPESARNLLNVAISRIRRWARTHLGLEHFIVFRDHCYRLHAELPIRSDFQHFRQHFQQALTHSPQQADEAMQHLLDALQCYKGDFLEDLYSEPWVGAYRAAVEDNYLDLLNRLSEQLLQAGRFSQCVEIAQKMLQLNEGSEAAHLRLVQAYRALGLRDKAIRQYRRYKCILEDMKLRPTAEMLALLHLLTDAGAAAQNG